MVKYHPAQLVGIARLISLHVSSCEMVLIRDSPLPTNPHLANRPHPPWGSHIQRSSAPKTCVSHGGAGILPLSHSHTITLTQNYAAYDMLSFSSPGHTNNINHVRSQTDRTDGRSECSECDKTFSAKLCQHKLDNSGFKLRCSRALGAGHCLCTSSVGGRLSVL